MEKDFEEVNLDTIQVLKAKGFKNIQLNLLYTNDSMRATVEVIPGKEQDFNVNLIPLNSPEILDYFNGPSPLAIDQRPGQDFGRKEGECLLALDEIKR